MQIECCDLCDGEGVLTLATAWYRPEREKVYICDDCKVKVENAQLKWTAIEQP